MSTYILYIGKVLQIQYTKNYWKFKEIRTFWLGSNKSWKVSISLPLKVKYTYTYHICSYKCEMFYKYTLIFH